MILCRSVQYLLETPKPWNSLCKPGRAGLPVLLYKEENAGVVVFFHGSVEKQRWIRGKFCPSDRASAVGSSKNAGFLDYCRPPGP